MVAAADDATLYLLEFVDRRMLPTQIDRLRRHTKAAFAPGDNAILAATQRQLGEYFAGRRRAFDLPLALAGTDFQRAVWGALRAIPHGETRTYAELATAIGRPSAVRAVGRANGDYRLAIVVPCHRVIGADGALVGYGGLVWRKQALLALETNP
jgi:O-6-methylguanine DNA methyltransferase